MEQNQIYLWLDLTDSQRTLVDNHHELRYKFRQLASHYSHLKVHDGDFDPVPEGILIMAARSVPSSKYCMAKVEQEYRTELDRLKVDLIKESDLEKRVIGPTDDPRQIRIYGDNFELHEKVKKVSGLGF